MIGKPFVCTTLARDVFARSGFLDELGADRFSFTTQEAVQRALGETLPFEPRATL